MTLHISVAGEPGHGFDDALASLVTKIHASICHIEYVTVKVFAVASVQRVGFRFAWQPDSAKVENLHLFRSSTSSDGTNIEL
ncbi:hypothetical protein F2P81_019442 [Scophthalmus maximus]|uniref:Uncharacterized protein n=1 Tax=Scophthalmus maximus TaxID=52904 RepID=A0A6A4S7U4_SCOMX|nr:hypothetical protein F2P81_019442 [Scophthalmus maximus]